MTRPIPAEQFRIAERAAPLAPAAVAITRPARPLRGEYGRSFDLHPALFALTVGGYIAYLGIMGLAFMEGGLVIPMAIFLLFVIAAFGTPALWAKIAPSPPGQAPSWSQFMHDGFECLTGHVSGGSALCQVLIMPALIVFWGTAVAIIAACVR